MRDAAMLPSGRQGYGPPPSLLIPLETGAPMPEVKVSAIASALALAIAGTTVSGANAPVVRMQDVGLIAPAIAQTVAVGEMLRVIRRRTALTWDQLGSIFAVSRRSLHHWVNGQTVSPENAHKVSALHERVLALGDQPAFVARSTLLAEYGVSPAVEPASPGPLPFLVADQTPIDAKVNVNRSPGIRTK